MAVVDAAGHEVVARAFRGALGEHGGFDVDETVRIEELAHLHRHLVAQHQVVLHVRAAQVQHAMREARGFRQVLFVDLERRRDRRVQHVQLVAQHFDLAGLELIVGGARRARTHHALDLHAELIAHVFGHLEHLRAVGVTHHLHITFAVAQVDENHASMVAAAVDPARQGDGLAHQGFGHKTAIVGTHGHGRTSGAVRGALIKVYLDVSEKGSAGATTPIETI